jgi:hypothetical protein
MQIGIGGYDYEFTQERDQWGQKKGHGGRIDSPGRKGIYALRTGKDSGVTASHEIEDFGLYLDFSRLYSVI